MRESATFSHEPEVVLVLWAAPVDVRGVDVRGYLKHNILIQTQREVYFLRTCPQTGGGGGDILICI